MIVIITRNNTVIDAMTLFSMMGCPCTAQKKRKNENILTGC